MDIETLPLEVRTQPIDPQECSDPSMSAEQLTELKDEGVAITKGSLQTAGAKVNFFLLESPSADNPQPLGIVNGLCASQGAYKPLAASIALRGYNVFHICPPRKQALRYALQPEYVANPLKLQAEAVWAVGKVAMQHFGAQRINLYGHSKGGATSVEVAQHHPGKVGKLILAASVGMDGQHTLLHRAIRLPRVFKYDIGGAWPTIRQNSDSSFELETINHIFRRPFRTANEAYHAGTRDIRGDVDAIQDSGTRVGMFVFGKDGFFDENAILQANIGRQLGAFMRIPNVRHVYVQEDPDGHSYDVDYMLSELEEVQSVDIAA